MRGFCCFLIFGLGAEAYAFVCHKVFHEHYAEVKRTVRDRLWQDSQLLGPRFWEQSITLELPPRRIETTTPRQRASGIKSYRHTKAQTLTLTPSRVLGYGGTSEVFVDSTGKYLIKLFRSEILDQDTQQQIINRVPFYEREVTEYYRQNGVYTPPIVFGPVHVHVNGSSLIAIVRGYREGINFLEAHALGISFGGMDQIQSRVQELHEGGRFRAWLRTRLEDGHISSQQHLDFLGRLIVVDVGDAKQENFLYTLEEGWILNDP